MTQQLNIVVGEGDTEEIANLAGIPPEMWAKFKEKAQVQFPQHGADAWAAFLSEVIAAGSGGDGTNVTYFMTNVPVNYANAITAHLAQINMTWDQFHTNLLRTAILPNNLRLANFRDSGFSGIFIATGVDPLIFTNIEQATGKSFEQVMATIMVSAGAGSLSFGEATTWLEPKSYEPEAVTE